MENKILVITATLGDRDTLSRTIDSVKQIGGNLVRHVIVCPKDRIPAIKEKYGDIECLAENKDKRGIYAALNHGFNTYGHDYEYLTFINDDDYWLPNYRLIIDMMFKDKSLDLVYGRTQYINDKGEKIGSQTSWSNFKKFGGLIKKYSIVLLTQQSTLIKSSLYFNIGGFDDSYKLIADSKFWIIASMMNIKYKYINKECAAYTIQEGQLSSDHDLQAIEHKRMFEELPEVKNANCITWLRYRMANFTIYFSRIIKGGIKNPFTGVGKIFNVMVVFMPWRLKRFVLTHCYHYDIHPKAYIGLAYVYPKYLKMDEGASIGHFSVAVNLDRMVLGKNVHIGRSNWITGFPTMTNSKHFAHDKLRRSELIIGEESSITKHHHIDCTNAIHIGHHVTIAGYYSQLLTHSIDVYKGRQDSHPISIGDYCFVSTGVKILGGTTLPDCSVLAAGAVLNKPMYEPYSLYGGVPAKKLKDISHDAKYMTRETGYVW